MFNFLGKIVSTAAQPLQYGAGRVGAGLVGGGLYGGLTSESNTDEGIFRDAMLGAAAGGLLGGLTTKPALNRLQRLATKKGAARVGKAAWWSTKKGIGAGVAALDYGMRGVHWMAQHPRTALGLGVGAAGLAIANSTVPSDSGLTADQMAKIAVAQGGPSTGFNIGMGGDRYLSTSRFQQSAAGLTQGLHNRRHG